VSDRPEPSTDDRGFGIDELFFSATDEGGRILTGNAVFTRVSGYTADELHGRAHNVVRHPDTPRVVFRILWEHLQAGEPVAAFVKNRTKDGRAYWVVATAGPVEGGYLSVRFAPSGEHFAVVREVYRELVEVERAAEAGGAGRSDAIEASRARLDVLLADLGFAGYDAFMRAFLPAEMRSREAALAGTPYWERMWGATPPGDDDPRRRALLGALSAFRGVHAGMDRLFGHLDDFARLSTALASRSQDLTGGTRLLSLNALLGASRLGHAGATLAVVAHLIGREADRAAQLTDEVGLRADGLRVLLDDLAFRIAVGRLQAEMAVFFCTAVLRDGGSADEVPLLSGALSDSMGAVRGTSAALVGALREARDQMRRLSDLLGTLAALQLNGTIEASRAPEAATVRQLFLELRERLDVARAEVSELMDAADAVGARAAAEDTAATEAAVARMRERATALALAA
jgi:aerotaxis receptor